MYIYKYGVFGYASSAYWWSRLGGALVRAAHHVGSTRLEWWALMMADDIKIESSSNNPQSSILWFILFLLVLRVPFSWNKVQGGTEVTWIGYSVRLWDLSLGISASRARWAVNWLHKGASSGIMDLSEMKAALGRLAFVAGALEYDRPFLAPLFSYVATVKSGGLRRLPLYVRMVMHFLWQRIEKRHHYPSTTVRIKNAEGFRVDAHAEADSVGIGGWWPKRDESGRIQTRLSPWFSVKLTRETAPWAYHKGEPFRAIAALEALAALVAVKAFGGAASAESDGTVVLPGFTDNRGNKYVLSRLQTSKFPLCLIIMELATLLEQRRQRLEIDWSPREVNAEADRLAEQDWRGFSPELRVDVAVYGEKAQWLILDKLMAVAKEFDSLRASEEADTKRLKQGNEN